MEKMFLVFLLLVLDTIGVIGQVSPIMKVIPNHNYTVDELKEFVNSNDPIVNEWMQVCVYLTQDALLKCGEDLFFLKSQSLKDATMFIIEHSVLNIIDLNPGFKNSGRTSDNKMKFVVDPRKLLNQQFLSFEYGSCHKDLVKMNCFNLPDLPEMKLLVKEEVKEEKTGRLAENNWRTYRAPQKIYESTPSQLPITPIVLTKETSKFWAWQKKNWWWEALGVGFVTGFVAHDNGHIWYLWFPKGSRVTNEGHDDTDGERKTNGGHY